MQSNTAFGFVLVGLSLVLYIRGWLRVVPFACIVIVIGLVILAECATGAKSTRFDTLLGVDPAWVLTASPGRRAFTAAFCFVMLGLAMVLLDVGRYAGLRQVISAVVMTIGSAAIIGYALWEAYLATWLPGYLDHRL